MISVRAKYHLLLLVVVPLIAFLLFIPMIYISEWFIIIFFAWIIIMEEIITRSIKCPKCKSPVGYGTYRIRSHELFKWWKAIIPRNCEVCGNDLTKNEKKIKSKE